MLIPYGCSLTVKPLGITDNAVSYSFILSLTLLVLWVVALSKLIVFYILSWKIEYFCILQLSILALYFHYFIRFHVKIQKLFLYTLYCCNFLTVSSPSFSLKINKGASFSPHSRIVQITFILEFCCPCVLILTFIYPIACTAVVIGIFEYIGLSSMLVITYNS